MRRQTRSRCTDTRPLPVLLSRLLREVTAVHPNVRVDGFQGLLVDYCLEQQAEVVIKGIRAVSDFDYELKMAQMNVGLAGVETLFMPTAPVNSFLSSSLVKEVAAYGGEVGHLLPPVVHARLLARLRENGTRSD